jgi:hypothetical protein
VNKSELRATMVGAGETPRCPRCRSRLGFGTDRSGRTLEQCVCGYRQYVEQRTGRLNVVTPPDPATST